MASLNEMIAKGEVCRCLRSKKLFYQADGVGSTLSSTLEGSDGPFWCVLTQSLQGPDGKIVDDEACRPGRTCCQTA